MGIPRRPVWRRATWPRIISWPWMIPAAAFPKKTISTWAGDMSASASASRVASSARERTDASGNLPKRVIPTPATYTGRIAYPSVAEPVDLVFHNGGGDQPALTDEERLVHPGVALVGCF